jgi:hypothetical protein
MLDDEKSDIKLKYLIIYFDEIQIEMMKLNLKKD